MRSNGYSSGSTNGRSPDKALAQGREPQPFSLSAAASNGHKAAASAGPARKAAQKRHRDSMDSSTTPFNEQASSSSSSAYTSPATTAEEPKTKRKYKRHGSTKERDASKRESNKEAAGRSRMKRSLLGSVMAETLAAFIAREDISASGKPVPQEILDTLTQHKGQLFSLLQSTSIDGRPVKPPAQASSYTGEYERLMELANVRAEGGVSELGVSTTPDTTPVAHGDTATVTQEAISQLRVPLLAGSYEMATQTEELTTQPVAPAAPARVPEVVVPAVRRTLSPATLAALSATYPTLVSFPLPLPTRSPPQVSVSSNTAIATLSYGMNDYLPPSRPASPLSPLGARPNNPLSPRTPSPLIWQDRLSAPDAPTQSASFPRSP